nr:pentapeptide repeat-containing protein [Actinomadura sp. J1-007]
MSTPEQTSRARWPLWMWPPVVIGLVAAAGQFFGPLAALVVATQTLGTLGIAAGYNLLERPKWPLVALVVFALATVTITVGLLRVERRGLPPIFMSKAQAGKPADLRGRRVTQKDVRALEFRGARLSGADLNGLDLRGKSFNGAEAVGVNFSRTRLDGVELREPMCGERTSAARAWRRPIWRAPICMGPGWTTPCSLRPICPRTRRSTPSAGRGRRSGRPVPERAAVRNGPEDAPMRSMLPGHDCVIPRTDGSAWPHRPTGGRWRDS